MRIGKIEKFFVMEDMYCKEDASLRTLSRDMLKINAMAWKYVFAKVTQEDEVWLSKTADRIEKVDKLIEIDMMNKADKSAPQWSHVKMT
ncbi:unnamed protein product [Caenorhabditis angaria]|uniref:Uncharacterized protein n=1 Tax=Caenorhabditis angaria TaxID=860376 RepID=A0A9P1J3G8_9PELO|nr:unnamed protein product [Caenorhabditis angaria]